MTSKNSPAKDAPEEATAGAVTDVPPADARVLEAPTKQPDGPEPGGYEYTYSLDCVYAHVPLTARAAQPAVPATEDSPAVPAVEATVFDWPFGPPDDGRWTKTRKKSNQRADNEPPLSSEE